MALKIVGRAAAYGNLFYPVSAFGPIPMRLEAGAFDGDAAPAVEFLANHEGLPLAATDSTSKDTRLVISRDDKGIGYEANLSEDMADAVAVWQKVDAGLMRQASIGFYILDAEWETVGGEEVLTISNASMDRGDVSVVRWGANPNTESATVAASEPKPRVEGVRLPNIFDSTTWGSLHI